MYARSPASTTSPSMPVGEPRRLCDRRSTRTRRCRRPRSGSRSAGGLSEGGGVGPTGVRGESLQRRWPPRRDAAPRASAIERVPTASILTLAGCRSGMRIVVNHQQLQWRPMHSRTGFAFCALLGFVAVAVGGGGPERHRMTVPEPGSTGATGPPSNWANRPHRPPIEVRNTTSAASIPTSAKTSSTSASGAGGSTAKSAITSSFRSSAISSSWAAGAMCSSTGAPFVSSRSWSAASRCRLGTRN